MGIVSLFQDLDFNAIFSVFSLIANLVMLLIVKRYQSKLDFHSYRSTKIYDRQLNVIVDLHGMLVKLHGSIMWMTRLTHVSYKGGDEDEKERRKNVDNFFNDFDTYYFNNLILLPKTTADKIQCLRESYHRNSVAYIFAKDTKPELSKWQERHDQLEKIHKNIEDMQPSLDQLAEDFRSFIAAEKIGDLVKKGFLAKQTKTMKHASKGD
ncbi:MAG: hypothetical protein CRN43_15505 [Candidatus Nephrothrix sp. EaCA]|nr:MAG: hypothetical protein CRN43_15505 [Candidatus Nephrothrix sp. EaCA]